MKQISLANAGFTLAAKRTRKGVFLDEMYLLVPWANLVMLIEPYAPSGSGAKGGRPPFPAAIVWPPEFDTKFKFPDFSPSRLQWNQALSAAILIFL